MTATTPEAPSPRRETTKQCPQCGNTYLILLRTLNCKHCVDCNIEIPWYLEPGQKPLT